MIVRRYEDAGMQEELVTETVSAENLDGLTPSMQEVPICVDLDGTLVRTDLLHESLLALLRMNAFYLVLLPFWLLKGKAYTKCRIAQCVTMDMSLLPYNEKFLGFLRQQHSSGLSLIHISEPTRQLMSSRMPSSA